jgi:excisionase family DNA binding protein
MTDSAEQWLAVGQAAERLGVSTATLRRYERDGLIRSHRTPTNQRRFRLSDIEALLAPPKKAS